MMSIKLPAFSIAMVSLTKRFSCFMRSTEKAIAMDTARGRPSGTQQIIKVTVIYTFSSNCMMARLEKKVAPEVNKVLQIQKRVSRRKTRMLRR